MTPPDVSIGALVATLDAEGLPIECRIVQRYLADGVPHAVLLPTDGGYSLVRSLASLGSASTPVVEKKASAAKRKAA